jgi:hypothetical protein
VSDATAVSRRAILIRWESDASQTSSTTTCTARSKPAGRHAAKRQLKTLESGMAKRSNPAANHGANRHLITA